MPRFAQIPKLQAVAVGTFAGGDCAHQEQLLDALNSPFGGNKESGTTADTPTNQTKTKHYFFHPGPRE